MAPSEPAAAESLVQSVGEQPDPPAEPPAQSPDAEAPRRWRQAAWAAGLALGAVVLVVLAAQVRSVTVPLLVAFTLAYILDPLVDRLEARGLARTTAILILLTVFLLGSAALVVVLAPQVFAELAQLPERLRELLARLLPWLESTFQLRVPHSVSQALEVVQERLRAGEHGVAGLARPAGSIIGAIFGGTVSVLAAVAGIAMIPVFQFFLLRDFDHIVAALRDLVPARYREPVSARAREIDVALSSFVRGQLIVACILAALYSVGLFAVGLPLALVVGLIAGFGNMIPYLGTALGLSLAVLMALLEWHGPGLLVAVLVVFAVVQVLEAWVITPRIVGDSVGLSSFAVIVAVLIFGELFGFFGVLVAVPLAAVLKILLRVGLERYRASAFYRAA